MLLYNKIIKMPIQRQERQTAPYNYETNTDVDNIYYNMTIPHNDGTNPDGSPSNARFFQVRSEPLLKAPASEYSVSIVRYSIPTSEIPIQIVPIEQAPANVLINKTTYGLSVKWNGNNYSYPVLWRTQSPSANVPVQTITGNNINTQFAEYYSLKSIEHFLDLINETIEAIVDDMVIDGFANPNPPFLFFDSATNLISLYTPRDWANNGLGTEPRLYLNGDLYDNFQNSFDGILETYTPAVLYQSWYFNIIDRLANHENLPIPYGANTLRTRQEFKSTLFLSTLSSVLFITNSLPVRSEWISGQNRQGNVQSVGDSYLQILTDFEVQVENLGDVRGIVNYVPTAEYRRSTMDSQTDITIVDIEIFYKDKFGNVFPLKIPRNGIATIKMLFEKKTTRTS